MEYGKVIDVDFKEKKVNCTYEYRLKQKELENLLVKFKECALIIEDLAHSKRQVAYMRRALSSIIDELQTTI